MLNLNRAVHEYPTREGTIVTLASVPEYDPGQITRKAGHAVVVGAGMAGLLTARVLADSFEQVTLVEKDSLPDAPVTRKGIPQGKHIHNLHEAGRRTLEDLFPGFSEEVSAAGGTKIDLNSDFRVYIEDGYQTHGPSQIPMYCASRPLFELITRRRVTEIHNITLRENCQFIEYLVGQTSPNVEGVTVRNEGREEEVTADLVVDATGRTSRTPNWLADQGYPTPPVDEVHIDIAYSTAIVNRPEGAKKTRLTLPNPPRKRGGGLFPVENERWLMTLFGVHGDHPPTNPGEFQQFAASFPVNDFQQVINDHGLGTDAIQHYPFPSNKRIRYEELDHFPKGLLVIGDGIASFNPIYGQGMSVAALEAIQLHHTLAAARNDELAQRFFQRAATIVDDAWMLAVGSDFQFEQTTGPKPTGTDLINRYLSRLLRTARTDGKVADAFHRVIIMEERPTSLFRPRVMWRVLTPNV